MRKNDLISKLQAISGNPKVMIWNGLVEDFLPVGDVGVFDLIKQSKEDWLSRVRSDERRNDREPASEEDLIAEYNRIPYEVNSYITYEDVKKGWYKKKKVLYIDTKATGKSAIDRLGNIEY